jgi:hypothetical protein
LVLFFLLAAFPLIPVFGEDQYIYFGYVPEEVEDEGASLLYIVGNHDGTTVRIYLMPDFRTIADFSIDKMELRTVEVHGGEMFKVVASMPATLVLAGGTEIEERTSAISTFYTSTEGGYVGREFIFPSFHDEAGSGVYAVYALEKAEVTIFNSAGGEVERFDLGTNEFRDFGLDSFQVFRLVSTGYVMLQSFSEKAPVGWMTIWKSHGVPSLKGRSVGTYFYARGINPGWQAGGALPKFKFMFTSAEAVRVTAFDLKEGLKIKEEKVDAGEDKPLYFFEQHFFFQTDRLAFLNILANGGGLIVGGLRGGDSVYIYVPSDESFLFAYDETVLEFDDAQYSMSANEAFRLPEGFHKIGSDKTVIIVMVDYGSGSSLLSYGACLPSTRTFEIDLRDLEITPLGVGIPWLLYVEGGAAAAAALVAVYFIVRRTRKRTS